MCLVVVDGRFQFAERKNLLSQTSKICIFFTNQTLDPGIGNLEISKEESRLDYT
jgi:hypothetical protein